LETLVKKRTVGLMRPKDAPKIEKSTRKQFPDGIESYGTDALRFTFAILATQGRGINFDVARIQGYRNFCNKLWNASRYVMMCMEANTLDLHSGDREFNLAERWINTRLARAVTDINQGITNYRFDLSAQAIYEFTWDEYCDWYLELSKVTLTGTDATDAAKRGTLYTLLNVLETLLRLMHPFTPFITEEIWQRVAPLLNKTAPTIMLQAFPQTADIAADNAAMTEMEWVKSFILGVRRIRSERDIAPGKALAVQVKGGNNSERNWLAANRHYITTLAKTASITEVTQADDDAVIALAGEMTLLVPLADLIDPKAEAARLEKELTRLRNERDRLAAKLANSDFTDRAPAPVVQKERDRLAEVVDGLGKLEEQYQRILKLMP
jgi:valyl-tRNA synthetase